ncbi:hypothetical protein O9929_17035 [Vibrio lentus]|nr:hypothetical protein [Vibrio lentus]
MRLIYELTYVVVNTSYYNENAVQLAKQYDSFLEFEKCPPWRMYWPLWVMQVYLISVLAQAEIQAVASVEQGAAQWSPLNQQANPCQLGTKLLDSSSVVRRCLPAFK